MTIPEAFELALQHHQGGRLVEAEQFCRQILAVAPRSANALHLLGVIAHQAGRSELAVELIRQAIALRPDHPAFHSNLGLALGNTGQFEGAIAAFRRALQLKPDYAKAHNKLGNALEAMGNPEEAIGSYRRALDLNPDYVEAHCNLGVALAARGRFGEAITAYHRVLQLKPDLPEARNNLGHALAHLGCLEDAVAEYRRAIELKPDMPEVRVNLGNALKDLGRLDEAIAEYRRALQSKPDMLQAHVNLGDALRELGQLGDAIAACRRAIALNASVAEAHNNLGNALKDRGQLDEAIAAFRRAIELKPEMPEAHNNLGNALKDRGHLVESLAAYHEALRLKPDYAAAQSNLGNALKDAGRIDEALAAIRGALELKPGFAEARSNLLLGLHYLSGCDAGQIFAEHCRWDELHARPLAAGAAPHGNVRDPERRSRIGYVSPDFREHSVAFFFEGLLSAHDRSNVEIFCYANLTGGDEVSERLRRYAGHWRTITGVRDEQVAGMIRGDGIDILVDLAGHTACNRLLVFARKPAPVQVSYLGYCDTTGMRAMDYRLTDAYADPPGATGHLHAEQLVHLPDSAWCFRPSNHSPPVGTPPSARSGIVTFGCFNALPKMTDENLALWSRILLGQPRSRLLLKNLGFREPSAQSRVRAFLANAGIAPERIGFVEGVPAVAQHLAFYDRVDIALDTFPYHGTATTCEAMWQGVPVVALAGRTHAARVGVSLLSNAGLLELIAHSPEEYVKIAAALAGNVPRLAEMRSTLREKMAASLLMDAPRFTRNVERAYRDMWRAWCAKQCPNPRA